MIDRRNRKVKRKFGEVGPEEAGGKICRKAQAGNKSAEKDRGRTALFAALTTPAGRFLVEGDGALATVFLDEIHEHLVDPTRTDELLPPEKF